MPTTTARPRSAGRQRDKRTDAALINAVLDLVNDGATLSGLSFVAIAEHAGVSRNSLYRRWKTKDGLYLDVLASLLRPLPELSGRSLRENLNQLLAVIIERTMDQRANQMILALGAEANVFPQLHRRYYEDVIAPRRAVMLELLREGVEAGEISDQVDLDLAQEVLVAPILARVLSTRTHDLDPFATSARITDLIFDGLAPRSTPAAGIASGDPSLYSPQAMGDHGE